MIHVRRKLGARSSTFKTSLARRTARSASSGGEGVLPSSRVGRWRRVLRPQVSEELRARDADTLGPKPHRRSSCWDPGGSRGRRQRLRGALPGAAFPGPRSRTQDEEAEQTHRRSEEGCGGTWKYVSGGWDRGSVAAARPDAPLAERRRRATRVGARAARTPSARPPARSGCSRPQSAASTSESRRLLPLALLRPLPSPSLPGMVGRWHARLCQAPPLRQRLRAERRHQAAWLGPHGLRRLPGPALRAPPGPLDLGRVGGGRHWAFTPSCDRSLCRAPGLLLGPLSVSVSFCLSLFSFGACEVMI